MPPLDEGIPSPAWGHRRADLADAEGPRELFEARLPAEGGAGELTRRRWLQRMGASLALAGAAGCRFPTSEIVPLAQHPEGRVPGEPECYATAMDVGGSVLGLLVTARDGRPVKIEGNPRHPASLGRTHALAQAALLQLYDPDRSQAPIRATPQGVVPQDWSDFEAFSRSQFATWKGAGGATLRVLSEASTSPTLARMRSRLLQALPQAKWYEYEPLSHDHVREGARLAFGGVYRALLHLDQADVIVCLDCDLLGSHPAAVRYAREFAARRDPRGAMTRLYAVESGYSLTGSAADHRLPMRSGDIATFASELEAAIQRLGEGGGAASGNDARRRWLAAVAKDLAGHRGRSVIAAGPAQPPLVHAVAHRINHALGNAGRTVTYTRDPDGERLGHVDALRDLVADIRAGRVEAILVLGGNPVYNAPCDLAFAAAYQNVATRIHLSLYRDETSRISTWHLPQAHFLESWGDARAFDGTYSVIQPLIAPLYGGKSASELVAMLLGEEPFQGYELVRQTFGTLFGEDDLDRRWKKAVHDGLLEGSAWMPETPALRAAGPETAAPGAVSRSASGLEIAFYPSASLHDGRFANNGWLQETPDPLTKLTWDNAAIFSPASAFELGIESGTLVTLKCGGRELLAPAYVLPGQASGSVAIALGYGRTAAGHVGGDREAGIPPVGCDAYALRRSDAMYFAAGLEVLPSGKPYRLATTEDHHVIDAVGVQAIKERAGLLAREATLEEYRQRPDFARHAVHHPPLESLWREWSYEGRRWGMAIDLSKCIGCNACVVACQAENNVPVVGKELVLRGREMHWMRLDRYFLGTLENPRVAHQVVTCHHCENAPCEQVCPVAATVHSREGLNDMVYNRCVGTRYCANNCPYKVRRFNYFSYHQDLDDPQHEVRKMVYNPEVTIRARGVMEKCTYCVQRIQAAKIKAKNERRPVRDGEILTACQQACPTQAIEFGDLSDASSRVRRAQAQDRAYALLAELNVKPRTMFLAKIRHPNPELEHADHEHARRTG